MPKIMLSGTDYRAPLGETKEKKNKEKKRKKIKFA